MSTNTTQSTSDIKSCPIDHTKIKKESNSNYSQKVEEQPPSCPVDHTKFTTKDTSASCPVDHSKFTQKDSTATCPVDANDVAYKAWLDLNPNNLMEKDLNRETLETKDLNKAREVSSIPNGEGDYWVYPSETQFYNAMQRKSKNPTKIDMKVVVPIHNAVNERAWNLILKYEEMYKEQCKQPKLVRFQGKPQELTIKARFKSYLGYTLPFDRHDWYVDRCGKQVKYIIDFYSGKSSGNSILPSFYLDVRPDLSFQGLKDRVNFFFHKYM